MVYRIRRRWWVGGARETEEIDIVVGQMYEGRRIVISSTRSSVVCIYNGQTSNLTVPLLFSTTGGMVHGLAGGTTIYRPIKSTSDKRELM